ncbi:hypothetical protein JOB18_044562 [Solea senegalensis]|uniref:Uncharacterized protein n=1 Tax=Solea senegalensis TaxID=28829 RepID=A0AAV6R090_SOLSE|nr:hypothetical protein JOB18_044562 [Solea senegalensis]
MFEQHSRGFNRVSIPVVGGESMMAGEWSLPQWMTLHNASAFFFSYVLAAQPSCGRKWMVTFRAAQPSCGRKWMVTFRVNHPHPVIGASSHTCYNFRLMCRRTIPENDNF